MGELIIKENKLIITVRKSVKIKVENPIAWDINLLTLDGYDGGKYHIIGLENIYTIHRVYELKRRKIQQLPGRRKKRLFQKYHLREKNRVNYALHKIAKQLANRTNIFEDLKNFKEKVARTKSRSRNRQNSKHDYIKLQKYVEYKSAWNGYQTIYISPHNSSKTCSRCGYINKDLRGARVFKCPKCGLVIDRQKNASRNIYNNFLKMWGAGFPPKGANPYEMLPMNPEGDEGDEAQELSVEPIHIYT